MGETNAYSFIKKRVLHIAKWYPNKKDVQNGIFIKKHVLSVADGTHSSVLFFKQVENLEEPFRIEKTQSKIKEYFIYHKRMPLLKTLAFKKKILSDILLEIGQPDIIHLHILSVDQLIFARFALKQKIPFFVSEHWSGFVSNGFRNLPKVKQLVYKRIVKRANAVFPVSHFLKQGMQNAGLDGNYFVLPNIVELPKVSTLKNDVFTFVVVSDIVDAIKNISGIVSAFQELKRTQPNIQLNVIGDGPDFESIESLVAKQPSGIQLKGRLPNELALVEIAKAHCLVVNSWVETFSVVCLEARAQGLQVITSDCGGPSEYADSHTLIIPKGNYEKLKLSMQNACKEPSPPNRNIKGFSYNSIGIKLLGQYNKVD